MSLKENLKKFFQKEATPDQVEAYAQKLDQIAAHPESKNKLAEVMRAIDQSTAMKAFRKQWDRLPKYAQCGFMYITQGPLIVSSHGPVQTLVKCGLIDYKGHQDEYGKVLQEKIESMGFLDKIALKYGVKLGKYIWPELKAIEPFIEPILKVMKTMEDGMRHIREDLIKHRAEIALQQRTVTKMTNSTHVDVNQVLNGVYPAIIRPINAPSLSTLPDAPVSKAAPKPSATKSRPTPSLQSHDQI